MKLFSHRRMQIGLAVLLALLAGTYGFYRHRFPYGMSHCCILQFTGALEMYAQDNKGYFPAGQSSPEASLSLLYRAQLLPADILRGKTVPAHVVEKILRGGGLLRPETCGWHYHEGLSTNDDSRIAVIWDKVGLGHDGQNIDYHEVLFLDGDRVFIPKSRWNAFLAEQQELVANRALAKDRGQPVLTAVLRSSTGSASPGTGIDYPFKLFVRTHEQLDRQSFVTRSFDKPPADQAFRLVRAGQKLTPAELTWYSDEVPKTGTWEMALVVDGHYAWEVFVVFQNGKPDQPVVSFEVNRSEAR
jgi:hypothetical protein